MSAPGAERQAEGVGRPGICVASGALMLAVPVALRLVAPMPASKTESDNSLIVIAVLAVGAVAVALSALRPRGGVMPALAVLAAAVALLLEPPEAFGDGICGLACLCFLLAVRLHRQTEEGTVVDVGSWLDTHRPMLVGAGVTTPAAVAAAVVPSSWSLVVAALVGVVCAGVCAMAFLT
ncbi:MAG TPA: hypothetical protein VGH99_10695 [Pseudonocardia sp.]|jgi:hypothetical protein